MTVIFTEEQKQRIRSLTGFLSTLIAEHPTHRQALTDLINIIDTTLKTPQPAKLTAAERMHQGCYAEMHVEEVVDQLWPDLVGRVGSDHYDNSLELFFLEEAPETTMCTEAQAIEVFKLGFSRFWLNFCDGTEQAVCLVEDQIHLNERRRANVPRGGVRASALRSKLYALIDRKEEEIVKLNKSVVEMESMLATFGIKFQRV